MCRNNNIGRSCDLLWILLEKYCNSMQVRIYFINSMGCLLCFLKDKNIFFVNHKLKGYRCESNKCLFKWMVSLITNWLLQDHETLCHETRDMCSYVSRKRMGIFWNMWYQRLLLLDKGVLWSRMCFGAESSLTTCSMSCKLWWR